jgi:hypothetical protein
MKAIPAILASGTAFAISAWLAAGPAWAQPAPPAPLATPNPTYEVIVLEQDVARPAAEAWKQVGGFCDIQRWFPGSRCQITSGKDGELGAVRTINGSALEILVGKTELSYTYTQPVRVGQAYNLYHGALEARPVTATTSKLVYSFVQDTSTLADAAARKATLDTSRAITTRALANMKILAEGGTLPAPRTPERR